MNILPFPKEFDQNEWFIIICIVGLVLLIYKLPKRFPPSITILILLFTIVVSRVVDHLIAGPKVDYYDIMDTSKFEFFDLFCYVPYAPFGYLYLYLYDKHQWRGFKLFLYIICFALGSLAVERLLATDFISFFKYKSWKVIYSLPVYLMILPTTLLFFHIVKNIHKKSFL